MHVFREKLCASDSKRKFHEFKLTGTWTAKLFVEQFANSGNLEGSDFAAWKVSVFGQVWQVKHVNLQELRL